GGDIGILPADQPVPPAAGAPLSWGFTLVPNQGFQVVAHCELFSINDYASSISTPCSSNHRTSPASRAASASASVSALSSSTWVPPSCSALATKPKSSCTPISIQPYSFTHLSMAGNNAAASTCSADGSTMPTR